MIVSITMDFALDHSMTYSGGLGILEADKFYAFAEREIPYLVLTLFHRRGYVAQRRMQTSLILEAERPRPDFLQTLYPEDDLRIRLNGSWVYVKPLVHAHGAARAVFFEAVCPEWARMLTERLYITARDRDDYLKLALLARAAYAYLTERVGWSQVRYVDLQEARGAFLAYAVPEDKLGLVTHTPGPWGHPRVPRAFVVHEFRDWTWQGRFPAVAELPDPVNLTELALKRARRVFAVSEKHTWLTRKMFPEHAGKIRVATNGIHLPRWQDPALVEALQEDRRDRFIDARRRLRQELLHRFRRPAVKGPVILWARRMTRYKRPYFVTRFLDRHPEVQAFFVIGGRPHPDDMDGIRYAQDFLRVARERDNVFLVENFNLAWARFLMRQVDLLLFTPFPGWEACGTSFMKCGVNGIPSLASRDGGALEMIEDRTNGWFFGHDSRELVDLYHDPRAAQQDQEDFQDFEARLLEIIDLYHKDPDAYYEIGFQAARTFTRRASIERTLARLYPEYF